MRNDVGIEEAESEKNRGLNSETVSAYDTGGFKKLIKNVYINEVRGRGRGKTKSWLEGE